MSDAFSEVVGQPAAISMLRAAVANPLPAYLLVGSAGCGARAIAISFAAELLAHERDDSQRHRRLAISEEHPDLIVFERTGPSLTVEQAREIVRAATTSPFEGNRKIILVEDIHLAIGAAPMILKVLEEPPPSTYFILTAQEMPTELATIASRCTQIDLAAISPQDLVELLLESGVDAQRSSVIAAVANGSIDRALLLASDAAALERWTAWQQLRATLDGSGNIAAAAADRLLAMIDNAAVPLQDRQVREHEELDERAERFGERGLGRRSLEDRHKRELRRLRTDELVMGITAIGISIRDDVATGSLDAVRASTSLTAVTKAGDDLRRNPNERLLLQRLFMNLN
jgi:DNA polymerase-3 subunit delta'|tara:strand:- start:2437 stop:3468 length:1032 start_codon:yes stop_codon:yes gene_type:complete